MDVHDHLDSQRELHKLGIPSKPVKGTDQYTGIHIPWNASNAGRVHQWIRESFSETPRKPSADDYEMIEGMAHDPAEWKKLHDHVTSTKDPALRRGRPRYI